MSATPWSKFFWADWESDQELGLCSVAAQGLWMRMLCLAARSRKPGYVMIADRPASTEDLSRIIHEEPQRTEELIAELETNGVFSRDRSGIIYSRRMVREAKKRKASAKGGKIGGRTSADNKTGIHATPEHTPRSTPDATPPPMDKARFHIPEARSQKPDISQANGHASPSSKPKVGKSELNGFEQFWAAYPRKAAKGQARKAYAGALRKASAEQIAAGARRYARSRIGEDERFTKHPATWLNGECWADGGGNGAANGTLPLDAPANGSRYARRPGESEDHHRVRQFVENGVWLSSYGSPPLDSAGRFNPDCTYPAKLLAEFGIKPGCEITIGRPN